MEKFRNHIPPVDYGEEHYQTEEKLFGTSVDKSENVTLENIFSFLTVEDIKQLQTDMIVDPGIFILVDSEEAWEEISEELKELATYKTAREGLSNTDPEFKAVRDHYRLVFDRLKKKIDNFA